MTKPTTKRSPTTDYAAFLRGINVGGNNIIAMADLRAMCADIGFTKVKTILASGNVVFTASGGTAATVGAKLAAKLHDATGRDISVIIRTVDQIRAMLAAAPFAGIVVTPDTRLYVTLLPAPSASKLKLPYTSPDGGFRILRVAGADVFSVLTVSPDHRTVDAMQILEKEFGKSITTRNWNTIAKIAAARPSPNPTPNP
ncbi:MAG: DUF1697 domain-containing protein [Dehalococcoidia bacterium]